MVEVVASERPEPCDGCSQADGCGKAYRQLGEANGPSMASKAVIVFALPIVVFAAALAGFERLLPEAVAPRYRTPVALLLALSVTIGVMLIVSRLTKRRFKRH
jgi:hypothetical protein